MTENEFIVLGVLGVFEPITKQQLGNILRMSSEDYQRAIALLVTERFYVDVDDKWLMRVNAAGRAALNERKATNAAD